MSNSLSHYEMQLVTDANVLLAKNRIIQTVSSFLGEVADNYKAELENKMSGEERLVNAKISRGENYQGLPYVIMDYPRLFGKTNTFAVRSFFWWGNFFSITLHLSGEYQQKYAPVLKHNIRNNYFNGWYLSASENQWQHCIDEENYVPVKAGADYEIEGRPFIKLAKKIPLNKWDEAYPFFIENFILLMNVLQHQAPIL